jgi:hypothetical protein
MDLPTEASMAAADPDSSTASPSARPGVWSGLGTVVL